MPRDVHRRATLLLSASLIVIGIAIVARTIESGGSGLSVGIILGVLFVLAGAGRLWVALRAG
jgi:hypothetical protein